MSLFNVPFDLWMEALHSDQEIQLEKSQSLFEESALLFYQNAGRFQESARALYEYSTLMDSFSEIQKGRCSVIEGSFEEALKHFVKASEIVRSTVHFGFLSPFLSAAVTLEISVEERDLEERFQGYRNSIALFEQSKMALSFRDDRDPLMNIIDSMLKLAMSRALNTESLILTLREQALDSQKKERQSLLLLEEHNILSERANISTEKIPYFPVDDWKRINGAFIVTYPDLANLMLLNIGSIAARVSTVGKLEVNEIVDARDSLSIPLSTVGEGRTRISYTDTSSGSVFDEGCLILIK